jgi:hypothetical protein
MKFAINVGLNVKGSHNNASEIAARAQIAHLAIGGFIGWRGSYSSNVEIKQSDSEPTLVMSGYLSRLDPADFCDFLYKLAVALGQDCIAFAEVDDGGSIAHGWLVGPHASAWGDFNPAFFVL